MMNQQTALTRAMTGPAEQAINEALEEIIPGAHAVTIAYDAQRQAVIVNLLFTQRGEIRLTEEELASVDYLQHIRDEATEAGTAMRRLILERLGIIEPEEVPGG